MSQTNRRLRLHKLHRCKDSILIVTIDKVNNAVLVIFHFVLVFKRFLKINLRTLFPRRKVIIPFWKSPSPQKAKNKRKREYKTIPVLLDGNLQKLIQKQKTKIYLLVYVSWISFLLLSVSIVLTKPDVYQNFNTHLINTFINL